MDEDYQRDRAIRKQKKAQHVGEGFVYGITDFGIGLYKGITGVVVRNKPRLFLSKIANDTCHRLNPSRERLKKEELVS
jgi:hypothetical protein